MRKELTTLLSDHPWADRIHHFETIGSTNDEAKRMALDGAPHGTVLIADHQTGGRGRMGRQFHSPAGSGIYLSVILRPDCKPTELMHLTCAAGVAMCDAVAASCGFRPGIKWINDLVYDRRKIGGILAELSLDSAKGKVAFAVIGIGINCTQIIDDFPPELQTFAGSLAMFSDSVSRPRLAANMVRALHRMDRDLLTRQSQWMDTYRRDCNTLGQEVSVHRFDEVRHGIATDVDEEGGLLVRFSDGHTETVAAGEVSIRGMYGYV